MAKSSVRASESFLSTDWAMKAWKPEQETVIREFLGGKNVFAPCLRATANRCVRLFSTRFWPFLASETSAEHTDRAACIDKRFRTSHKEAKAPGS